MKKFLPILLALGFCINILLSPASIANAQTKLNTPGTNPTSIPVPTGGLWVVDPEVTFIGKNAARSGLMLDWTLQNYNWVCVTKIANRQCDDTKNPLASFWGLIVLYIVVPMLFVVILATSIVIIITRGKSLTIMRFIPRFVAVILLIVFSYSLLQFLYQFTDLIQGFFLRSANTPCPPDCISQKDLLYVGWDYRSFIGLRLLGDYNAESAFISLLLTKLTALTYFVMVGILLMRKIILWFFIIVSPIFPLLLLYYPVRNTGKIWIGEFFRWLLYAPLFAIFLKGLVYMWRNQIPLWFTPVAGANVIGDPKQIIFPTAVNILLGGPRQFVTPTNSVNLTETFALYVVALIMLWIVILLPWILLQIFLDYASNFAPGDSAMMKQMVNLVSNKMVPPSNPTGYGPQPPAGGGAALNLPFTKKFTIPPVAVGPAYKPTGEAKQINIQNAEVNNPTFQGTQVNNSRFAQPISLPNAQVNAEVVSLANVSMPSMRDIAKYETAMISNDTSRQSEISQIRETLEKIANPVAVTSTVEREKYVEIHDRLERESQQGNLIASSVLNAANVASKNNVSATNAELKNTLQQIANPASAPASVDREKLTKLHDVLSKASKDTNKKSNSELASQLLSVNSQTSEKDIEKIKESLTQVAQMGNSLAGSVLSTVNASSHQAQQTTQIKSVLQQVAAPATAKSPIEREKMTKMNEALKQESLKGNDLATSLLNVTNSTSSQDIEKLKEKLMQAKETGSPLATQLLAMTPQQTTLPAVNRVQAVNQADYEEVKKMWKENYHKLEVPQGMAASRTDWMKDDIEKINTIVDLLSSSDQDKVNEGMDQVSNILPFLLVGGFSQTEIVAYLKAKQEAAKETLEEVTKEEEETTVSVEKKAAQASATMAANMDETSSTPASAPSATSGNEDEEPSVLENIQTASTTIVQPQVQITNDILQTVNVKIPRMRDIARYETMALAKNQTHLEQVKQMHEVLANIANPSIISTGTDREKYEKLKEKLLEESKKGNLTANVILSAATSMAPKTDATATQVKSVLQQIANPEAASEKDKEKFKKLNEQLAQASQQGNQLASSILGVKDTTSPEELDKIKDQLKESQQKGESLATSVLSNVTTPVAIPTVNNVQTVDEQEYEEVKKMWKDNYHKLEIPQGMAGNRTDWISDDISRVENIINLLTSNDAQKEEQGLQEVANILPFLLIGGFTKEEIVSYLKAKLQAAKEALSEIKKEEEETTVSTEKKEENQEQKSMTAEQEASHPEGQTITPGEQNQQQAQSPSSEEPKVSE